MSIWPLWIRAADAQEAADAGRAWAEAEPNLRFVRIVSVEPREFDQVWTVTVEAPLRATEDLKTLTLGLDAL